MDESLRFKFGSRYHKFGAAVISQGEGFMSIDSSKLINEKTNVDVPVSKKRGRPRKVVKEDSIVETNEELLKIMPGASLDLGTSYVVGARARSNNTIMFNSQRDAFFEIETVSPVNKKLLIKGLDDRGMRYLIEDNRIIVVGDSSIIIANERHHNVQRPMARGVLSPKEKRAFPIIKELIKGVIGSPLVENEVCVYSIPASPIDEAFDSAYHESVIKDFLTNMGYTAVSLNEAEAIVYNELIDEGLTGIGMSFGAGSVNICLESSGEALLKFSIARSGDYIDQQVAHVLGLTETDIQVEKEHGNVNIITPDENNNIHKALSVFYGNLLMYVIKAFIDKLNIMPSLPSFRDPIPLVIAGGTSMITGFIDTFNKVISVLAERGHKFPFVIGEVRHSATPLYSVAKGCLLSASLYGE